MRYNFTLERRKKEGVLIEMNMPIRISVNHNKQRMTLSTGFRVDLYSWDESMQVVKKGFINNQKEPYNIINAKLSEQKSFLDRFSLQHQLDNSEIILEDLKVAFAEHFSRKKNIQHKEEIKKESFFELFDRFVKERGKQNDWTDATYTKFKAVRKHLLAFDGELYFDALIEEKLTAYVIFLRTKANMKNSTIKKQLGFFKWFLNWAVDKGHCSNLSFKTFKPKLKTAENQVIYLDKEELTQLKAYIIPESKAYLERVRDVFLFCCYTSLRYSDVYQLKRMNVINDRISFITVKTTDKLGVKLNVNAMAIIEKYKSIPFKDNKVLPVISNQKMNDYLKELCELAKIDTPVTLTYFIGNQRHDETYPKYNLVGTHTGRRTFICNALINGMPPHAVMKITGHKDYKAMKPYIDIISKDLDNMVDQFINF